MKQKFLEVSKIQNGFSLVEILIVLTLIVLVGVSATYFLSRHQKLYKPDDQTLLIADILQEARQRSLTQRETLRVEIDLTENQIRLIDENSVTTADDDEVTAKERYYNKTGIRISLADSKAKLPGCSSGVSQTLVATACGIRLDGSQDGQGANPGAGASRGYTPRPMADSYRRRESTVKDFIRAERSG